MLVPGIVDSDKHGSTLDVVGDYSPCDSLETAYVADNGFTSYADGVWSAVQSEHVAGLAVRSNDYLAERTEDVAVFFGVSVQNFVGDAFLYVSIYDTGTETYVGVDVGETITSEESLFARVLTTDMYGKLRIRIDIIGDTVAFDSITLHSIYTYECPPTIEGTSTDCDPYWDNVVLAVHMDEIPCVDEKGHAINTSVTVVLAPSGKFGGAISSNSYQDGQIVGDFADFALGTGDFTIEAWLFLVSFGQDIRLWQPVSSAAIPAEIQGGSRKLSAYNAGTIVGGDVVPLNEWVHIAFSRQSGVLYAALNGVIQWSSTFTYNFTETSWKSYSNGSANLYYVDDLRVTKGIARPGYTADFDPPTQAFPNVACVSCDPYWDNVVLAMHFDNNLTDLSSSPSTMTMNGDGTASYAAGKFDNGFNFNGSTWFWTSHSTKFDFGLNPVTIELFYKTTSTVGYHSLFAIPYFNTGSIYVWHKVSGGNKWIDFRYMYGASAQDRSFDTGYSSSYNEPIHLEIVRNGGFIYIFIDGELKTTISGVSSTEHVLGSANAVFVIGAQATDGSSSANGVVVDDVRITKGVARYTEDFSDNLPTKAFPDINCDEPITVLQTAATIGWSIGADIEVSASMGWTVAWAADYEFARDISVGWGIAQDIVRSVNIRWTLQANDSAISVDKSLGWSVALPFDTSKHIGWSVTQVIDTIKTIKWTIG